MGVASNIASEVATIASPIASGKECHRRLQTIYKTTEINLVLKQKHNKVALIDKYVRNEGLPSSLEPSPSKVTPSPTTRRQKRKLPSIVPDPPIPAGGKSEYGMGEFLQIINSHPKEIRRRLILKMRRKDCKFVKAGESSIYRLLNAEKCGVRHAFDQPWYTSGRQPKIANSRIKLCAKKLSNIQGMKHMKDSVNEILVEEEKRNGGLPEAKKQMNPNTVNNYMAIFAQIDPNLTITDNSIAKTNARYTAENSLIQAINLLVVIAMTHFYIAEEEDLKWRQLLSEIPDEDKLLYRLVCEFHGNKPVRARPPHLIFNQDDTTDYICKGTQPEKSSKVGLVSKASLHSKHTKSTYHMDNSNNMNGRRVKQHFISNGVGDCAPPVYCFCGLTKYEMPTVDFIVWKVEGLCVGGYGVNGSKSPGYVLFMRGGEDKGAEKERFRWIQENIFFPFIDQVREEHTGFVRQIGVPIPEEETAVGWCDGDISQLATIIEKKGIELFSRHKVIANKHGANATGVQQSNDMCDVFTTSKSINKTTTLANVPSEVHKLKRNLEAEFKKEERNNRLFFKKKDAACDYLGKQPTVLTISRTREKVAKGNVANGMLDSTKQRIPVLQKIVSACKTVPKPHHYELLIRIFPKLMGYSYYQGMHYTSDSYLVSLGFPIDIDAYGVEKLKDRGISLEAQQRAKCLTGEAEIESRAKRDFEIDLRIQRSQEQTKAKADQKRDEDQTTVNMLCAAAGKDVSIENLVQYCSLKHFAVHNADVLRDFVAARHPTIKTPTGTKYLKKPRTLLEGGIFSARKQE